MSGSRTNQPVAAGSSASAERLAEIEILIAGRHLARPLLSAPFGDVLEFRAELVVQLPLLLVAQPVVGVLHFLEFLLGRLVVRIHVRMVFPRQQVSARRFGRKVCRKFPGFPM